MTQSLIGTSQNHWKLVDTGIKPFYHWQICWHPSCRWSALFERIHSEVFLVLMIRCFIWPRHKTKNYITQIRSGGSVGQHAQGQRPCGWATPGSKPGAHGISAQRVRMGTLYPGSKKKLHYTFETGHRASWDSSCNEQFHACLRLLGSSFCAPVANAFVLFISGCTKLDSKIFEDGYMDWLGMVDDGYKDCLVTLLKMGIWIFWPLFPNF